MRMTIFKQFYPELLEAPSLSRHTPPPSEKERDRKRGRPMDPHKASQVQNLNLEPVGGLYYKQKGGQQHYKWDINTRKFVPIEKRGRGRPPTASPRSQSTKSNQSDTSKVAPVMTTNINKDIITQHMQAANPNIATFGGALPNLAIPVSSFIPFVVDAKKFLMNPSKAGADQLVDKWKLYVNKQGALRSPVVKGSGHRVLGKMPTTASTKFIELLDKMRRTPVPRIGGLQDVTSSFFAPQKVLTPPSQKVEMKKIKKQSGYSFSIGDVELHYVEMGHVNSENMRTTEIWKKLRAQSKTDHEADEHLEKVIQMNLTTNSISQLYENTGDVTVYAAGKSSVTAITNNIKSRIALVPQTQLKSEEKKSLIQFVDEIAATDIKTLDDWNKHCKPLLQTVHAMNNMFKAGLPSFVECLSALYKAKTGAMLMIPNSATFQTVDIIAIHPHRKDAPHKAKFLNTEVDMVSVKFDGGAASGAESRFQKTAYVSRSTKLVRKKREITGREVQEDLMSLVGDDGIFHDMFYKRNYRVAEAKLESLWWKYADIILPKLGITSPDIFDDPVKMKIAINEARQCFRRGMTHDAIHSVCSGKPNQHISPDGCAGQGNARRSMMGYLEAGSLAELINNSLMFMQSYETHIYTIEHGLQVANGGSKEAVEGPTLTAAKFQRNRPPRPNTRFKDGGCMPDRKFPMHSKIVSGGQLKVA